MTQRIGSAVASYLAGGEMCRVVNLRILNLLHLLTANKTAKLYIAVLSLYFMFFCGLLRPVAVSCGKFAVLYCGPIRLRCLVYTTGCVVFARLNAPVLPLV